ncbi:unnamed protein product, partial [Brassica rapa]
DRGGRSLSLRLNTVENRSSYLRFHRARCPKPAVVPSSVYCHSYPPRRHTAAIKRRDPYEDLTRKP